MILGRNPSGQAAINEQINDAGGDHQERVVRGGRRTPIPIFEIVVADIVPLKISDQVHADRLVISGHSLALDESSMTGESNARLWVFYPRWGRCYESFSEDTEVVRKLSCLMTGLQGQPPEGHPSGYPYVGGRNNVAACAKHFGGDGGTLKGILHIVMVPFKFEILWNDGKETFSGQDLSYAIVAVGETPYAKTVSDQVTIVVVAVPEVLPLTVTLT
nr:lysosomal beta glucosidase-like protein [Ipomoea batatas]